MVRRARVGTASKTGDGRARHTSTGWLTKGNVTKVLDDSYSVDSARARDDNTAYSVGDRVNGTGGRIRRWERLMIDMRGAVGSLFDTCTKEGPPARYRVLLESFTMHRFSQSESRSEGRRNREQGCGNRAISTPGTARCGCSDAVQARVHIRSSQRPLFSVPGCVCSINSQYVRANRELCSLSALSILTLFDTTVCCISGRCKQDLHESIHW